MPLSSLCIFCGSSHGTDPVYAQAAQTVGHHLAQQGYRIVYGAGSVGLMGVVADAALAAGGEVIGVIPSFLKEKEVDHQGLTEMIVTDTMHTRKARMAELSDGFIALPGGFGTLDELAEILTWAQLGLHQHPIGLLNVKGYFDALITFLDNSVSAGFLRQENRDILQIADDLPTLLDKMAAYQAPDVEKWLNKDRL